MLTEVMSEAARQTTRKGMVSFKINQEIVGAENRRDLIKDVARDFDAFRICLGL